jgi:hypothetical protein
MRQQWIFHLGYSGTGARQWQWRVVGTSSGFTGERSRGGFASLDECIKDAEREGYVRSREPQQSWDDEQVE